MHRAESFDPASTPCASNLAPNRATYIGPSLGPMAARASSQSVKATRSARRGPALAPASAFLGEARPARAGPGSQDATDQPGSSSTQPVTALSRLPRRSIVPLAATASRALPAVASHAIGFADP